MLVGGDLVFGEDEACLRAPYLHIGIRGFRGNGDASSRTLSFGRLSLGRSGLSSFLQTPEQIRFPARGESEIVVVLTAIIAGQVRGETARHALGRLVKRGRRSVKVCRWHALRSCCLAAARACCTRVMAAARSRFS